MIRITEHILETKKEDFDTAYLEDRYRTVLVEKLRKKQASKLPARNFPSTPSAQNVINLMDALRKSVGSAETQQAPAVAAKKPSGRVKASKSEATAGIALVKPAKTPSGKRKSA